MTKLFKNSKQVLSFVLAFAVLAVSLFTGVVINSEAACDGIVDEWKWTDGSWYDETLADNGETGADWDNAIIIDSAREFAWLASKSGSEEGKYYKVADGIKAFNMTPSLNLDGDLTPAEVEAALNTECLTSTWWNSTFAGAGFDGNGVIIYGIQGYNTTYGGSGALFYKVKPGVTIKNLTLKNSYFYGDSAGSLFANVDGTTASTITIENVVLTGNVVVSFRNNGVETYGGVMFGQSQACRVEIKNCLVYNNEARHAGSYTANGITKTGYDVTYGLFGSANKIGTDWSKIENSIILDCLPFSPSYSYANTTELTYNNVYTNMLGTSGTNTMVDGNPNAEGNYTVYTVDYSFTEKSGGKVNITASRDKSGTVNTINKDLTEETAKFFAVTKDGIKGAAGAALMTELDWDNVWFANAGIPELRVFHDVSDEATAGTNGHTVKCADCGLVSVELAHTYDANNECTACGAEKICGSDKVVYWDGTRDDTLADNGEDGSANNPIIIDSAEELAKLVRTTAADSQGKHYKVSDEISAIILQPETVIDDAEAFMALADAAAVKKYFEDKIAAGVTPIDWKATNYFWSSIFDGHFDGNNVEIYGLYSNSDNAALFFQADGGGDTAIDLATPQSIIEGGTTFKNFAVKNAYLITSNRGGVVGQAYGAKAGITTGANINGVITFDSCVVANCYMRQTSAGKLGYAGILSGDVGTDLVNINNCLVYGNDAWNEGDNCAIALRANGRRDAVDGETKVYNKMTNTIALGVAPYNLNNYQADTHTGALCFENVYTDQPAGAVEMKNTWNTTTTVTFTEEQIKQLTATTGAEIQAEATGLDWVNTWFAVDGDVPALRAFHEGFAAATDNGDGTHSESCNCGLQGAAVAHTFDKAAADGKCTVCGGDCAHAEEDIAWVSNNNATCLTADTGHYECTACGLQDIEMENPDFVAGHKFKDVEAIPADCQGAGTIAHKLCEVCGNAFATTAADDEPMENALESTVDPIKDHTAKTDSNGDVLYNMNETGHSKTCSVCNQEFGAEGHVGDYTYDAEGHNGSCSVCKMVTTGKENHTYVDGACTTCPYECPHNEENIVWVSNNDGACDKADTGHYECSACKLQDVEMENPDFVATEHKWIDDGEPVDLGWSATATACKTVAQRCEKCGTAGPNREIGHSTGFWEAKMSWWDDAYVTPCETDGQHTEEYKCSDCFFVIETKIVTDPKTGHAFDEIEAAESTCSMPGNIAYKYCAVCNYSFAADAAYDESHDNALEYDEINLELDPDNHVWAEYECTATCTYDGVKAHKFCTDCYLFVVDGEATDVTIDWDAFYAWDYEADEPIGIGAKLDAELNYIENETLAEYVAENYPDLGVEVPAYPEDPNDWDAMDAYWTDYDVFYQTIAEVDENWSEAWYEYWGAILEDLQTEAYHEALLEAAEAADVDMVAPADPEAHDWEEVEAEPATCEEPGCVAHKLCVNCFLAIVGDKEVQVEIDFDAINPENFNSEEEWLEAVKEEVYAAYDEAGILIAAGHKLSEVKGEAATTEKEGTKAHYACSECDKLFADAQGKEEVTAEKLVIAKLAKEDDKTSTDGDSSEKSPATGESVATVAAVAALMGAAFVLVRKARKA